MAPEPAASPLRPAAILRFVVLTFLASRVMLMLAGILAISQIEPRYDPQHPDIEPTGAPIIDMWAQWDTGWYMGIALDGYTTELPTHGQGADAFRNYAFFPAFPLLVRYTAGLVFGEHIYVPGLLLNCGLSIAAFYLIFVLCQRWFDAEVARLAVIIGCFGPYSFIFSCFYSEGLFILLTSAVLVLGDSRRWLYAGLCGALLSATRPNGLLIVVPALVMMLQAYPELLKGRLGRDSFRALATLPVYGLGTLAFMVYLHYHVGDALAFAKVQTAWGRVSGIYFDDLLRDLFDGGSRRTYLAWYTFLGLVLLHTLLPRRQWVLYAAGIALLLPALFSGNPGNPFGSMPRFLLSLVSLMIAGALLLRGRPWATATAAASLAMLNGALMILWVLGVPLVM